MTTLPRMTFAALDADQLTERGKLANEASRYLGYHRLAQAVNGPARLSEALRKLEIQPLIASSVERYKRSKEKTGMWSMHKRALLLVLCLCACISVLPALFSQTPQNWSEWNWEVSAFLGCVALTAVSGITLLVTVIDGERGWRIQRQWQTTPLTEYAGSVPEFALSKAVEIKRECPEANFYIEQLMESREKDTRPMRDPFLIAALANERYYIDVWDEREYERTM